MILLRLSLLLGFVSTALFAIESPKYEGGHWAFLPVQRSAPPAVQDASWPEGEIDRFILRQLEVKKLAPAPSADRRSLLRRVYVDLIGLSPSIDDVAAFINDPGTDREALARVVDDLLARPQYGERWGRYWLDLARYADTKGYVFQENRNYPFAYTYRDWVVRALNEDMPYDQFLRLQIAADQVKDGRTSDLAAMGFLTVGRRFLNKTHDIIDDRIDVLTRTTLGLTVACARCHDHPFDPIPTTDYYALFGVFNSSVEPDSLPEIGVVAEGPDGDAYLAELRKRSDAVHAFLAEKIEGYAAPEDRLDFQKKLLEREMGRSDKERFRKLIGKVINFQATSPHAPPRAMVMRDKEQLVTPHVLVRGNPGRRGDAVSRRFLTILSDGPPAAFPDGSGRLNLADAIADPNNPLTARVIVNRVWTHHMGQGLVGTSSDFGLRTERPSHPALLDTLARQFIDEGWSLKKLHRAILLSKTWRMNSEHNEAAFLVDPENQLYWRANRRRLDFEAMRDGLLQAAGRLDLSVGGQPVSLTTAPFARRRTIYGQIDRQNLPPLFRTFDLASPDAHAPSRAETTTPQQALFLMNSPFLLENARALAEQAAGEDQPIRWLHRQVLRREPSLVELNEAHVFLKQDATPPPPRWGHGYGGIGKDGVLAFTPFPHFGKRQWQGGPTVPDPVLEYAILNPQGGHPGARPEGRAVIRRWTAEQAGTVKIRGALRVPSEKSNGVEGWIYSSRAGVLHHAVVPPGEPVAMPLKTHTVETGEQLSFIVGNNGRHDFDSFLWSPIIESGDQAWRAADAFDAPPASRLGTLAQYAQVLLLSNEFAFVD